MNRIGNFVDGKQIEGLSNKEQSVFDPSKGEECNKVILSNKNDFDKVVESSKKSLQTWSNVTPLKRSRILSKYKELIEKNIDNLASLI